MTEENGLPAGWVWTTLQDTCEVVLGLSPPSSTYNQDGVGLPFYQGKAEFGELFPSPVKWCTEPRKIAEDGDILISVRAPVGPTNISQEDSCIGRGLAALRPEASMPNRFFLYYLRLIEDEWSRYSTGTTFKAISGAVLRERRIPLAPFSEQRRIVAKIEELLTRLDAGVAALGRARANLRRYKASVLKAACEGKLVPTEAEVADRDGRNYEPASELLTRILAERRAKWEAEQWRKEIEKAQKKAAQARRKAAGKPARIRDLTPEEWQAIPEADYTRFLPKSDKWKAKYKEPQPPDASELPELPKGWCWATVEQLAETVGGVTKGRDLSGKETVEVPYLRVANVQRGWLDLDEIKTIRVLPSDLDKYRLEMGDLLLTEGGDWDKLGRGTLWSGQINDCIHQNHVFRARVFVRDTAPQWLMYASNSHWGRAYFSASSKQTTNLASINLTQLRTFPIPIPPAAEQHRIVAEIERRLSVVAETEATLQADLQRAARLRQAILKRAFEGKLVPQDPEDEPASALLERIRAAKTDA